MSKDAWGHLKPLESYGRHGDSKQDYEVISVQDAKTKYPEHRHASHAMLFCRSNHVLWDLYDSKASVLMQMRFDGLLGFPGGLVDPPEGPVDAVNRELHEEICLNLDLYSFTDDNHIVSFNHHAKNLILHFYVKEVTAEEFKDIDKNSKNAYEYGIETLGNIRPPLYTMGDDFRGFPAFLCNQFAGNAREELLLGLTHAKIMTQEEVDTAVQAAETFLASKSSVPTKL